MAKVSSKRVYARLTAFLQFYLFDACALESKSICILNQTGFAQVYLEATSEHQRFQCISNQTVCAQVYLEATTPID